MTDKKIEIKFAPGCFDSFTGSQEELDSLMAEIQRLVDSGEIFERSIPLDMADLDDDDLEILDKIQQGEQQRKFH